jgi:hypothetical protein
MTDDQQHALQEQRHREALAVEMAGLRADAERWRWARAHPVKMEDLLEKFWGRPEDLDAAIDRAMQEGK